jgi:hypothetical protein
MYEGQGKVDREEYVRSHPIRARILALHEQDEQRPLSLDELLRELSDEATAVPVVAYHRRVLSYAGLLPRADD